MISRLFRAALVSCRIYAMESTRIRDHKANPSINISLSRKMWKLVGYVVIRYPVVYSRKGHKRLDSLAY